MEPARHQGMFSSLILSFYVEKSDGKCMDAIDVVTLLNAKLQSGVPLFDVDVVMVDTFGKSRHFPVLT